MEGVHHKRANVSTHISYRCNVLTAVCMATYVRHYLKAREEGEVCILYFGFTLHTGSPLLLLHLLIQLCQQMDLLEGDKSDCHRYL